ncbi:MAG: hypothetical protein Q9179_002233 [Wetmoreana sp. 5 TL-2023]
MPTSLQDLPPELLAQVVSYIGTVQALLSLALSCKKLHNYVQIDGYRAFVQNHYPSIPTAPFWKDAAHALTNLSRAWDRKSLVARCIRPPRLADEPRHQGHGRRARGQTMGYQPVIDSYQTWTGSHWTSRREVVAWGAGAELVLRVKWMGPVIEEQQRATHEHADMTEFDQHHHKSRWWRIKDTAHRDGPDDITAVMLLRDTQQPACRSEYIITGRANGELDMITIDHDTPGSWKRETRFLHQGQSVRFASLSSAAEPLLAACLGDRTIAIYLVTVGKDCIEPLKTIELDSSERNCRSWSTVFLRPDRLAVGLGPCTKPIRVFGVGSNATSSQPIRTFFVDQGSKEDARKWTIYSLAPLPRSSGACRSEGDLFLSGGYDGIIRLHDLRSPRSYVSTFIDPVDTFSAVYSLLPLGCGRFLAGSANHSLLKVFSTRTALEKLCQCDSSLGYPAELVTCEEPPERPSKPGAGNVIQLDLTAVYDRFPDPIFDIGSQCMRQRSKCAANRDVIGKWDPNHEVMCLAMYEQVAGAVQLKQQVSVGKFGDGMPGWDERWKIA